MNRPKPTNLYAEPDYPGLVTVRFHISWPDWVIHSITNRCIKDYPHEMIKCGEFE